MKNSQTHFRKDPDYTTPHKNKKHIGFLFSTVSYF